GHDLGDRRRAETEVGDRCPQRLFAGARGFPSGACALLLCAHEHTYAGETREETAAGPLLARRIVGIDAHQVARAPPPRLETLAEREDVAHAGSGAERLARDRPFGRRDPLAEVDLRFASEQRGARDAPQVRPLGVGSRGGGRATTPARGLARVRRAPPILLPVLTESSQGIGRETRRGRATWTQDVQTYVHLRPPSERGVVAASPAPWRGRRAGGPGGPPSSRLRSRVSHDARRPPRLAGAVSSFSRSASTTKAINDTSFATQCSFIARCSRRGMRVASWTQASFCSVMLSSSLVRAVASEAGGRLMSHGREGLAGSWDGMSVSGIGMCRSGVSTVGLAERASAFAGFVPGETREFSDSYGFEDSADRIVTQRTEHNQPEKTGTCDDLGR